MPLDRARIEYLIEDIKTRPERLRLFQRIGAAAGVFVVLLVVFLLARGGPPPKPKAKPAPVLAADPMSQGVRDAFEYAKAAQPILDRDSRFARVYFVPSAATTTQKIGKVVVMGEMAGEADLQALQIELSKFGVVVPVEWQVSIQPPSPAPDANR